ncbi:MAG: divergent PAP2 family protein [Chloroflexi bacterium]|nr:divergent PAP2 family protein [Chloroflexota bacterium]
MESLLSNRVLVGCVVAWVLAQVSKPIIYLIRHHRLDLRYLATAGGMPSSHSAVVCALATGIGLESGLDSTLFAIGVIFAAVVMYDAAGVRRAVSVQARILNRMLTEMIEAQHFNETRLRELIGHTPLEVFVGALLGTLTAISLG